MIFSARFGLPKVSPHTTGARILRLDATDIEADGVALDSLARLALLARRCGYRLIVRGASADLAGLIELAGLSEALGVEPLRPDSTPPRS
jgi:hypothetical protein